MNARPELTKLYNRNPFTPKPMHVDFRQLNYQSVLDDHHALAKAHESLTAAHEKLKTEFVVAFTAAFCLGLLAIAGWVVAWCK